MNYEDYQVEDFLSDASFVAWQEQNDAKAMEFWEDWLKKYPEKQEEVNRAVALLQLLGLQEIMPSDIQTQRQKNLLLERIEVLKKQPMRIGTKQASIRPRALVWWALAASVCLCLVAIIFWQSSKTVVYQTGNGGSKEIVLPDGSVVILNANSTLTFSDQWKATAVREVWLQGEGFFHVKADASKTKFWVHTNHLKVEVLGTKFNVNNRRGKTKVVLDEGKIKVSASMNPKILPVLMLPKEYVELADEDTNFKKKSVRPEIFLSWRNNQLAFDKTPLKQILQTVEDHYGVQIILKDITLATREFSGALPNNNLAIVLESIAGIYDLKAIQKEKIIVLE